MENLFPQGRKGQQMFLLYSWRPRGIITISSDQVKS